MAKASNHDEYIDSAAEWAQPILAKIRKAFHKAGKLNEEMKWSTPHFTLGGVIIGGVAAFKKHVNLFFWNGGVIDDDLARFEKLGKTNNCYLKIKSVKDLPSQVHLVRWIKQTLEANADGRAKHTAPRKRPAARAPKDLLAAITANKKAQATWDKFPPSHKREYIEWILEAKRETTRERRIRQAVEMIAEGKDKNWKYRK
ncbi:MAG: YdeI/OmpD-associated family protein [Planctomycetota bacterium]|jgi:uncharacterized protein YdeI (YjbR/CyaY-like superfamily)